MTRRRFVASSWAFALASTVVPWTLLFSGCGSGGEEGEYGQKFEKPGEPQAGAKAEAPAPAGPAESPAARRSREIDEDREAGAKKAKGNSRR